MPTYSILTRSHLNLIAVGMPPPVVKVADYRLSLVPHRSAKYSTFFRPTYILLSQLWYIEGLVIFQLYRHQNDIYGRRHQRDRKLNFGHNMKHVNTHIRPSHWTEKIPIHCSYLIIFVFTFVFVFIFVQVVGE